MSWPYTDHPYVDDFERFFDLHLTQRIGGPQMPEKTSKRRDGERVAKQTGMDRQGQPCLKCPGRYTDVSPPVGKRLVRCTSCHDLQDRFS